MNMRGWLMKLTCRRCGVTVTVSGGASCPSCRATLCRLVTGSTGNGEK